MPNGLTNIIDILQFLSLKHRFRDVCIQNTNQLMIRTLGAILSALG